LAGCATEDFNVLMSVKE